MKRRKGGSATTDLGSFLERTAAKKRQSEPGVSPTIDESQLQMVVFQEHSSSGPIIQDDEPVRVEP